MWRVFPCSHTYFDACKSLFAFRWRGRYCIVQSTLLQRRQRPCFDVRLRGMISKNNYESAILCKCIWELWRHARRSYFRRFHWISESFLFHSGGVSSPIYTAPNAVVDLYCPWMDFINDRRTSPDGCKPIILSLRTGLFYKAREFAWANFAHMRQPTPPPNVCTIGINCFALFYWIHA